MKAVAVVAARAGPDILTTISSSLRKVVVQTVFVLWYSIHLNCRAESFTEDTHYH